MYNILRKSIIYAAGLGLLFLTSCVSTPKVELIEKESLTIFNLFSQDRETILYVNIQENIDLINKLLPSMPEVGTINKVLNKSSDLFISYNKDFKSGFEGVLTGDFSKKQIEFGLFLSLSWKKVKVDGLKYWINKQGFKLYILDNNTIIIGNLDLVFLINNLHNNTLEPPTDSMYAFIPNVDQDLVKDLSQGFIRGGINAAKISINNKLDYYSVITTLELDSESKARSFSKLVNIFLKFFLKTSNEPEISNLAEKISIKSLDNYVIVENIEFSDIFIANFINNLIFIEEEADK